MTREGYRAGGRIWRQVLLSDGTMYYYCPETYETCYQLPIDPDQNDPNNNNNNSNNNNNNNNSNNPRFTMYSWIQQPLPNAPDWLLIENNGLRYYYNSSTHSSSWEAPISNP